METFCAPPPPPSVNVWLKLSALLQNWYLKPFVPPFGIAKAFFFNYYYFVWLKLDLPHPLPFCKLLQKYPSKKGYWQKTMFTIKNKNVEHLLFCII